MYNMSENIPIPQNNVEYNAETFLSMEHKPFIVSPNSEIKNSKIYVRKDRSISEEYKNATPVSKSILEMYYSDYLKKPIPK